MSLISFAAALKSPDLGTDRAAHPGIARVNVVVV
jgi:hypothetical protein